MTAEPRKPEALVIDDEIQIRRLLRVTLEAGGFAVRDCDSGQVGLSEIAFQRPDIVVLDLGLPDISGVEVLKRLREWTRVPVLILSILGHEDDKVAALDAGADDYLTKPFNGRELLARLRVMLRHAQLFAGADDYLTKPFNGRELLARLRVMLRHAQPDDGISIVRFGAIEIDFTRRIVSKRGEEVPITAKEYALLRLLVSHQGKVLTHRQILRDVWGPTAEENTHYSRVYLDRLRRKLEENPKRPKFFKTVLGVGYRFVGE